MFILHWISIFLSNVARTIYTIFNRVLYPSSDYTDLLLSLQHLVSNFPLSTESELYPRPHALAFPHFFVRDATNRIGPPFLFNVRKTAARISFTSSLLCAIQVDFGFVSSCPAESAALFTICARVPRTVPLFFPVQRIVIVVMSIMCGCLAHRLPSSELPRVVITNQQMLPARFARRFYVHP